MARVAKPENELQVFRGSKPRLDVFTANAGTGCCGAAVTTDYDRLGQRVRFDNALAHSNPTGANDKWRFGGNGFDEARREVIDHINEFGVGARVAVLAIPTYAFVTGVGVHIGAEETGLTFDLVTRNGLALPDTLVKVTATGADCEMTRVKAAGAITGFGALGTAEFIDIFGLYANKADGFALEADELVLVVKTLPASGSITGAFDLTVSVSYDVIHRAEK